MNELTLFAVDKPKEDLATDVTPVVPHPDGWWVKREDLAWNNGPEMPCGAKMRQFSRMINRSAPDAVIAMGCHAASAMQVYVAAMGELTNRPAYVAIPHRVNESASTRWAEAHGANITRVKPGYPAIYHKRIRDVTAGMNVVRWDNDIAANDTADQVVNLPDEARRVIVPTVSGLVAASVIGGLIQHGRTDVEVLVAGVASNSAQRAVETLAMKLWGLRPTQFKASYEPNQMPYDRPFIIDPLPVDGGVSLDPYYESKTVRFTRPGDVLWVVGRRPASAVG
jgi:hypothetical protein